MVIMQCFDGNINMAFPNQLFLTSVMFLLAKNASMTELSMVFLCDPYVHYICEGVITENQPQFIEIDDIHINLTGTALSSSGDFSTDVRTLNRTDNSQIILFVGIGNDHVVNAVSCIARAAGVPAVVYSTSNHRANMYEYGVISIQPDHTGLARAIITVIGKQMLQHAFLIYQDSLASDGFLEVFRKEKGLYNSRTNKSLQATISVSDSDIDLRTLLLNVHDNGNRLLVVHSSAKLFERLVKIAGDLSYFNAGYAWIITEEAMSYAPMTTNVTMTREENIPKGLLAVDGFEMDRYRNLLKDVIKVVRNEIFELLKKATTYNLTTRYLSEYFRAVLAGRQTVYGQFIRGILTNDLLFGPDGRRQNMQYRLLNFVDENQKNNSSWRTIGYIRGNDIDLNTVVWPGHSIFGPMNNARAFYSIVTRPAEPFVYVRGPAESRDSCAADTECLKVFTYDSSKIHHIIESFRSNIILTKKNRYKYEVYCCEGIIVDIIHALSVELKFDFLIYFQDDQNYGSYKNETWTGMVGDVISGAADLMAGAVSITSERMEAITFSEAFYFTSFSMVSGHNNRFTTLLAFMNPFHPYVWMMMVVSATSVAIITSLFEWNSPFGLNPWGKCRKKNYTLGSALTMVYSIWFGHTVKTKSPKSWPSKVLQNCWACLSIFVLAAYTANLAAFLTGNAQKDTTYSIFDARLYSKRIGVFHTSAAEDHIRTINPILQTRFKNNYLTDYEEAFYKLRNDIIDLYIEDTPLLEYALSRYDDNCSIKFASSSFGENAYAFGMKKGSWLKEKLDPLVLNFVELGYVEDLKWRYLGKNRQCSNSMTNTNKYDMQFDLKHTAGLFVFLLATIGFAIFLLVLEHITYFVILPKLKQKPPDSIWKKRNMEYFSQRLYKSINSEKVEPPAKVILSKVKRRKFEIQSRIRQARSVPANLSSYELRNRRINRILDIAYKSFYEMQNVHSDPDIYTISGSVDEEIAEILSETDVTQPTRHRHSRYDIPEDILPDASYDNPGFVFDDIDTSIDTTDRSERCETCSIQIDNPVCTKLAIDASKNNRLSLQADKTHKVPWNSRKYTENDGQNVHNPRRNEKRYETWPSPQARKRSVKRMQNNYTKSFSNADRENSFQCNRIVNEIPVTTIRTCSSGSLECLTRGRNHAVSLNFKNNRLKSNLRNHAMAVTERRRSMAFDQGAVEALSKEDLLILWKRSEIDLQTRLNRLLYQNSHLRRLVQNVEEYHRKSVRGREGKENDERKGKISNEQIRLIDKTTRQQVHERNNIHLLNERTNHLGNESSRQEGDVKETHGETKTKKTENDRNIPQDNKIEESEYGKTIQAYDQTTMKTENLTKRQENETLQLELKEDTNRKDDNLIMTTWL